MILPTLQVGSVVRLRVPCLGNPKGALGVCYEEYQLNGRSGYSFVFENGNFNGFSGKDDEYYGAETVKFFEVVGYAPKLSDYEFTDVMRLSTDFEAGVFDGPLKYQDFIETEGSDDGSILDGV